MESGKEKFKRLFSRKKAQAQGSSQGPDSSNGPAANHIDLKPNGDNKATRIKKTPLIAGMAVIGIAGYGAVEYMQHHSFFSASKPPTAKVKPAKIGNPPMPQVHHEAKMPKAPTQDATAPVKSAAPSPASSSAPKTKPKNPYAAQDAAFEASVGGGSGAGGLGLSWQQPQSAKSAPTATPTTLPVAEADMTGQQKKKTPPPLVTRETSPYELLEGAVIPAVLKSGIKSYLPGQIQAVVSQNVYSTVNGATLLIPAGSTLVGTYSSQTKMGTNRLAVA